MKEYICDNCGHEMKRSRSFISISKRKKENERRIKIKQLCVVCQPSLIGRKKEA